MTDDVTIRRLGPADAAPYRALRLRAVTRERHAFLITAAEERRRSLAETRERFRTVWRARDNGVLGAFAGDRLVGMCGFFREDKLKTRHRGVIWGMYVQPASRGTGVGRRLLAAALVALRAAGGIRQVNLCVTTVNREALALYRSAGFRVWGIEREASRVGDRWLHDAHMTLRFPRGVRRLRGNR